MREVEGARVLLEKAESPVSLETLCRETKVKQDDLAKLERNGVIRSWYKLADKTLPTEQFTSHFNHGGPWEAMARKIVEYLRREPDKMKRREELNDILQISDGDTLYVLATLGSYNLVTTSYNLAPDASCEICFYKVKCNKDRPAARCDLFHDDYRLTPITV